MPHQLDHLQGETLVHLAHTLRPEWTVPSLRSLLQAAGELPGQDWEHVVRALLAYATAKKPDGTWAKLTPRFFPEAGGPHWTTTAPKPAPGVLVRVPECEDHIGETAATCRCCIADVKLGQRPAELIGKHHTTHENDETPTPRPVEPPVGDEWAWDEGSDVPG